MAEDETDEDAKQDVKAKLAQMSGTRLRKERAERAAEKKTTTKDKGSRKREKGDPAELERVAKKAKEIEEMLAAEPSDPVESEDVAPTPPQPEPPQPKKRKRQYTPVEPDNESTGVPTPVAFIIGLLGGCLPAIVILAMGALGTATPEGLPAGAVEREQDWIHCKKADSANRWACDVFDYSGNAIGKGTFVPSVDSKPTSDWQILAAQDQLAIDGDYDNLLAQSEMVYVKGVAVSSKRLWGKK